ncbi:hypothetical protein FGE21_03205 [Phaeobacter sp. B1627]|nr:hypothetical protein FGE21_03205 [Phaeobacter sp. B1627]
MLVDIYARTFLNATLHHDLPQRPLPEAYRPPRAPRTGPGLLRRVWNKIAGRQPKTFPTDTASTAASPLGRDAPCH